jgi:hypothetical protein
MSRHGNQGIDMPQHAAVGWLRIEDKMWGAFYKCVNRSHPAFVDSNLATNRSQLLFLTGANAN